jgi:hypothetical protein
MPTINIGLSRTSGRLRFDGDWAERILFFGFCMPCYLFFTAVVGLFAIALVTNRRPTPPFTDIAIGLAIPALFGWFALGNWRTGRLQRIPGEDVSTNKEIIRGIVAEKRWFEVRRTKAYDIADPNSRFYGLPWPRKVFVIYDNSDILIGVVSYTWIDTRGPDMLGNDRKFALQFGRLFLSKLHNHSPDPTPAPGMPPAGQESRHG